MSGAVISLLIAISASVWIYSKLMRNTGGNTGSAATAAGISGVLLFVVLFIVTSMLL